MSDVLVVSGGGRITVAGDDLLVAIGRCRLLAGRVDDLKDQLPLADYDGHTQLTGLANQLRMTASLVSVALEGYSEAERALWQTAETVAGQAAYWGALLAPIALSLIPQPWLLAAAGSLVAGGTAAVAGASPRSSAAARRLLSDPRFVAAVRLGAGTLDDGFRGLLHLPWLLALAADDRGSGLVGREATARTILGALVLAGAVAPGRVAVTRVRREPARPPRSLADLAARVPPPVAGGPQVRIERYPHVTAVYLGGSVDLGLGARDEPWDLASNLAAAGNSPADSVAAAADALAGAHVAPEDPVVLVGYSQGGLVASRLAASGDYNVTGMLTLGSPGSSVPVPAGVPVLELEHAEDLVPALAGPQRAEAPERVTATRSLYGGERPTSPLAVPAHQLEEYRATAALADGTEEQRVSAVREELLSRFAQAGSGEATEWHAVRVAAISDAVCLPADAGSARAGR